MRNLVLCGLNKADYRELSPKVWNNSEAWVMNDWYQHHIANAHISMVWNIHQELGVHATDPQRFYKWEGRYNNAIALGAKLMLLDKLDDRFPADKQILFPKHEAAWHWPRFMSCTLAMMMAQVILREDYDEVRIVGTTLSGENYMFELPGVLGMIAALEAHGVAVKVYPIGRLGKWERRCAHVDWSKHVDAFIPYWMRFQAIGKMSIPAIDFATVSIIELNENDEVDA